MTAVDPAPQAFADTAYTLTLRPPVPFRDVRSDRDDCAPQLIRETEALARREVTRQQI